ncbi:antibiotic biosynthesis monooxygenase, partial [Rhizobium ruizarguesonis]
MSTAALPEPQYYMVSFSSKRTKVDNGYGEMGYAMTELAKQQTGYLG